MRTIYELLGCILYGAVIVLIFTWALQRATRNDEGTTTTKIEQTK